MSRNRSAIVTELHRETGCSRSVIDRELEKLESHGTSLPMAAETVRRRYLDTDGNRPWDLAGVGVVRGHMLYHAGYETIDALASASTSGLVSVTTVTDSTAACIHEVARNRLGEPGTMADRLASSLDVPRVSVADAYEEMAPRIITPEAAEPTLRRAFDDPDERSVFGLDLPFSTLHHLWDAGFESVDEVATAPISALEEVRYVGEARARRLHRRATDHLDSLEVPARDGASRGRPGDDKPPSDSHQEPADEGAVERTPSDTDGEPADDVDDEGFPESLVARDQWLLWKQTNDGRKIPRAPWKTGDALRFVSAMDPANWTSFEEARRWQAKLPHDLELAYSLTREDDVIFLDLDDVVVGGEPSDAAWDLIRAADSYTARSTSGTGVHVFVRGQLPEGIKSLTGPLGDDGEQSIEVYDRNRFVAMTGDHLDGTPATVSEADAVLERLEDEFASVSESTPDRAVAEPQRSRAELREMETTSEIQDLFDAIAQTRPSDITMRSTKTRKHADGTASYDPSWVHSESGTRLGVLDDVWIYRKGMIALNALQVVALEEGIITDERDYPEGEAFWDAVEALRHRGAAIPRYEPGDGPVDDVSVGDEPADGEAIGEEAIGEEAIGEEAIGEEAIGEEAIGEETLNEEALGEEALGDDSTGDGVEDSVALDRWEVAKHLNHGERVRTYVHPYDRDYQERLALELAPVLVEAASSLHLSPNVTYRAAALYAKAHAAGIVPGAAHESTLGAALRIASTEAGTPRPLADIADAVDAGSKSIRQKFHRLVTETDVSERISASDLIVSPVEYVPYMASRLEIGDERLQEQVRERLDAVELDGGTNPMSEVAAAFYVVLKSHAEYDVTQRAVADAAGLSEVTIRNNYRKFTDSNGDR